MTPTILGIHHVTAIAGDPQRNVDFYVGLLGLRLVKRTVNFDDPGTYHLYFGDGAGSPGTIITFFPWPLVARGGRGSGEVIETAFAVPHDSFGYWAERLEAAGIPAEETPARFAQPVLRFNDPDGMSLALVGSVDRRATFPHWTDNPVPAENAIRGFHSVTLAEEGHERTSSLMTATLGFTPAGEEGNRFRFRAAAGEHAGSGVATIVDLLCMPDSSRARFGGGSVHHVAFRVPDDAQQRVWRDEIARLGFNVTPIMDRNYFRSIYFREPGGVLFELATDPPGFAVDESATELGTRLMLPAHLERHRARLEATLPAITPPFPKATP